MENEEIFMLMVLGLSALVLASTSVPYNASLGQTLFQYEGFATLSLSRINFISNDKTLGGEAWLLTVVQNGAGQYAEVRFDPETLSADGKYAEHGGKIKLSVLDYGCRYDIQKKPRQLYEMKYYHKSWLYNPWAEIEECRSKPGYYKHVSRWPEFWCFWKVPVGKLGYLSTPHYEFESEIRIELDNGEVAKGYVSNMGQNSVWLDYQGKHVAYASWVGNLVTGEQCPIADTEGVCAYYTEDSGWVLADCDSIRDYERYDSSGFDTCLANHHPTDYEECVREYNEKYLARAMKSVDFREAKVEGDEVVLKLPRMVQFPVMTLRVKADWIGIYIPVGIPVIESLNAEKLMSGTKGYIEVVVRNAGDGSGSFGIDATCEYPLRVTALPTPMTLKPGDKGVFYVEITGTSNKDVGRTCRVRAYDVNDPERSDERSVTVMLKRIPLVCEPGQEECFGNWIKRCNAEGTGWVEVQYCEYGCTYREGKPTCLFVPCNNNGICEPELGENKYNCPDCKSVPEEGGGYQPPQDECDYNCAWYDVPCIISEMLCRITKLVVGILMWIVIIAVGIVVVRWVLKKFK